VIPIYEQWIRCENFVNLIVDSTVIPIYEQWIRWMHHYQSGDSCAVDTLGTTVGKRHATKRSYQRMNIVIYTQLLYLSE